MAYGRNSNDIREALLNRGWVEKLPPHFLITKSNSKLSKKSQKNEEETTLLSSFLRNYCPNFIWAGILTNKPRYRDKDFTNYLTKNRLQHPKNISERIYKNDNTIVSRLKSKVKDWCSKTGLCKSLKDTPWHYIEDIAEVYVPRTYINTDSNDLIDFVNDYLLTACTGLLRWILDNLLNGNPIFSRTGKISINVMVFALNRCKEYLNKKENKDIDGKQSRVITSGQWNYFITKHQSLIAGEKVFRLDKERNISLLMVYAHYLLKEIVKYRPQLRCDGSHNIWIIKPANLSSGQGIKISSELNKILDMITKTSFKYVVQKYIGKNY